MKCPLQGTCLAAHICQAKTAQLSLPNDSGTTISTISVIPAKKEPEKAQSYCPRMPGLQQEDISTFLKCSGKEPLSCDALP